MNTDKRPHGGVLDFFWFGIVEYSKGVQGLADRRNWETQLEACVEYRMNTSNVIGCILWHVCCGYTGFERRLVRTTRAYPFRFWHMVRSPPDVECEWRKRIAGEVNVRGFKDLGNTLWKIKGRYEEELLEAEVTGKLCPILFRFLLDLGEAVSIHTQSVEGVNNYLNEIYKRAPFTSLQTMSHRLKVRRRILNNGSIKKWSLMREPFNALRSMCLETLGRTNKIDKKDRWTTPVPTPLVNAKWVRTERECIRKWRATFCGAWFSNCKPDAFQSCLTITNQDTKEGFVYFTTTTHYSLVMLVRGNVVSLSDTVATIILDSPIEYYDHYDLIIDLYPAQIDQHLRIHKATHACLCWKVPLSHRTYHSGNPLTSLIVNVCCIQAIISAAQ